MIFVFFIYNSKKQNKKKTKKKKCDAKEESARFVVMFESDTEEKNCEKEYMIFTSFDSANVKIPTRRMIIPVNTTALIPKTSKPGIFYSTFIIEFRQKS